MSDGGRYNRKEDDGRYNRGSQGGRNFGGSDNIRPKSEYDGNFYKVISFGRGGKGDAMVVLPNGRKCFVKGATSSLFEVGDEVPIWGYNKSNGDIDFASMANTDQIKRMEKSNKAAPTEVSNKVVDYQLFIGPTQRADNCAIAHCSEDVLKMQPYDGLVHLISQYANTNIFKLSVDRNIAEGLNKSYLAAVSQKAQNEFVFTIGNTEVTKDTKGTLRQYFVNTDKVKSQIQKPEEQASEEIQKTVQQKTPEPKKDYHSSDSTKSGGKGTAQTNIVKKETRYDSHGSCGYIARSTASRSGSPGAEELSDMVR